MPETKAYLPWHNRFETPEATALIDPVQSAEVGFDHFQSIRELLNDKFEFTETIAWHGIPWRWSFAYGPGAAEPFAFLVPEPGRPQYCCKVPVDAADAITASKPHKSVREGLARGSLVGSTLWAEWELTPMARPAELAELAKVIAKHAENNA
ncbi:MAG: hypothetical protein AAF297_03845 [Planctomycetota bacterium]